MKIEREEVIYTYETEEEGINHQKLMESQGWKIRDVHPYILKITYVKIIWLESEVQIDSKLHGNYE
ncbi:hypothetical protein WGM54_14880 [Paenibacillus polymyxa]|uniref:hypothetical protein n=1 Tax=Paenibacillus polymyxa TaxID=1406 RepID=UPI00307DCEFB